ncbi:hypothetical protein V6N11_028942 [Hibiscus sabdariffa]|uniref:Uncharacterized protein n=2 Tax=Hibiscus sabdariffa TaxID=183260 RepID=A0ABR2N7V6_9ROSI
MSLRSNPSTEADTSKNSVYIPSNCQASFAIESAKELPLRFTQEYKLTIVDQLIQKYEEATRKKKLSLLRFNNSTTSLQPVSIITRGICKLQAMVRPS